MSFDEFRTNYFNQDDYYKGFIDPAMKQTLIKANLLL